MKAENLILFPFIAIWKLITFIFEMTGRLIAFIIGLIVLILGACLTATVLGAIIGIPMIVVGVLLIVRSFF